MARMGGVVAAGLGMVLLAGCGGGGSDFTEESADDIVSASKSDTKELTSVRVDGDITNAGQTVSIDLQLSTDGDCTGSMELGAGAIELLGVGGQAWMKPDAAAWELFAPRAAERVQAAVGDKWVAIPADDDSVASLCDLDQLLDEIDGDDNDTSYEKESGTEEIDGQEVVVVSGTGKDGTTVASILTDAPHYLVRMERTEGDDPGTVTFSDFDADVEVEEPAADEQVDLNSLGNSLG